MRVSCPQSNILGWAGLQSTFIYVPLVIFFALMGPHPNDGVKKARKGPYTQLI